MKRLLIIMAAVCVATPLALAQDERDEEKPVEDIRQEIEGIELQIEDLERLREHLERAAQEEEEREERKQWFEEMQAESRERMADRRAEIAELREEGEPEWAEEIERRRVRIEHLEACVEVDKKIQALPDASFVAEAERLTRELEMLEMKWWLVIEPRLDAAAELAEMAERLRELGGPPELAKALAQLREMHAAAAHNGARLYEMWKARFEMDEKTRAMSEAFWQKIEELERQFEGGFDELELPD